MSKLAQACELSLNDWLSTFPDIIPQAVCSKKHEKWKKKLFNKMRDNYYHRFTTKTVKVMLVAAVLFALLLTAFVIPSSRKFMVEKFDKYSVFQITKDNKNSPNGKITVGYIPDGFNFIKEEKLDYYTSNTYQCNNIKYFNVSKSSSVSKVSFNTETSCSEEIIIDNITYIFNEGSNGSNVLLWTKNDYIYRIDGNVSKEEMLKVAQSVE